MFADIQNNEIEIICDRIRKTDPVISFDRLDNGGRFISAEVNDLPNVNFSVLSNAGSRHEVQGQYGMLHFFEHLPPSTFSLHNGGLELTRFCRMKNWEQAIWTGFERLKFGFNLPDFQLKEGLNILNQLLQFQSEFYEKVFEREKNRILEEIVTYESNQSDIITNFTNSLIRQGTGHDHPVRGYYNEIQNYKFEEIFDLGRKFITTENSTFLVYGSANAINQVKEFFNEMQLAGRSAPIKNIATVSTHSITDLPLIQTMESAYFSGIRMCAFMPYRMDDQTIDSLVSELIKELFTSRLYEELSMKSGLTYSANAEIISDKELACMRLNATFSPENIQKVISVINNLFASFADEISEQTLISLKESHYNYTYLRKAEDKADAQLGYLSYYTTHQFKSQVEFIRELEHVTVEQVKNIINQYFRYENLRFGFIGSKAALEAAKL